MKIYLVGGAVRDELLGLPVKERDYVVVGATVDEMQRLGYRQVGKEFPVFLDKKGEEYALARMERKTAPGYKGFAFDTSPKVALEEDLIRRDLTINAMAKSIEGDIIDPYNGRRDLADKMLRHVSPAFAEDPVRILRVARLLARYYYLGFKVAAETITLMQHMVEAGEVNALVAERVWKEFERALGEKNPEQFFQVLTECHALPILFPALDKNNIGISALTQVKQSNGLHRLKLARFAVLLHDLPDAEKNIAALCQRYRAPNDYQTLAKLTARHYQTALHAKRLSAEELLILFTGLDVFRREDRFDNFITACKAIADAKNISTNVLDFLKQCALLTKDVSAQRIKQFITEGQTGFELAERLKKTRLSLISEYILKNSNPCK